MKQEGIDSVWKNYSEKIEEEEMEKTTWSSAKEEHTKEEVRPSVWRMSQRVKTYQPRKRCEDCW